MQYRTFAIVAVALSALVAGCEIRPPDSDPRLLQPVLTEEGRIRAVLTRQQEAWNRGDIDGFMGGYWQSPQLRFASGGTVTTGWQETRDRYHQRYSNRALMGTLSFENLEVDQISEDAAIVHGQWALRRTSDRPWGLFTLVFERIDGDWKIVSDTTTSADGS